MTALHPGRRLFLEVVRRRDHEIDVVRGALAIAWEDQDMIDLEETRRTFDALVARSRRQLNPGAAPTAQAKDLLAYLRDVEGFRGDTASYDDPINSYLPEVLGRRRGLPITLALVLLKIGEELGLPLEASALPTHFMVRCPDPNGVIYLDLFSGQVFDNVQCRAFLRAQAGYDVPDPDRFPAPKRREVLARILRNLKRSYRRRQDWDRALQATERILIVEPNSSEDVRDRGLLRARLGRLHLALVDLERYARMAPEATDQVVVQKRARSVGQMIGRRS